MICLHINQKVHMACDLTLIVKNEGVLKVTGSHIHFRSGIISETMLENIVTTDR